MRNKDSTHQDGKRPDAFLVDRQTSQIHYIDTTTTDHLQTTLLTELQKKINKNNNNITNNNDDGADFFDALLLQRKELEQDEKAKAKKYDPKTQNYDGTIQGLALSLGGLMGKNTKTFIERCIYNISTSTKEEIQTVRARTYSELATALYRQLYSQYKTNYYINTTLGYHNYISQQ